METPTELAAELALQALDDLLRERADYTAPRATKETTMKEALLFALEAFARQRPGFSPRNYGDRASYVSDVSRATRDLHHARTLIRWAHSSPVPYETLAQPMIRGNRLHWDGLKLDYCTGQYWPVEYRNAVVRALCSAVWCYARDYCHADTREKILRYASEALPRVVARRVG